MYSDIIIIGAGPVGLFTIFQAGMLGMKCQVIDSLEVIGGQCMALYPEKPIYDIPAHPQILAMDLIQKLEEQAAPFEPLFYLDQQVINLEIIDNIFKISTSKGTHLTAKVIVIAAGSGSFGPNRPPLEGIENFEGKSVFYLINRREDFRDKKIVIAGGGDSAVDWAVSPSEIARKIYVVHRRDKFRAAPETIKKMQALAQEGKIDIVTNYQLNGLRGDNGYLTGVEVNDLDRNKKTLDAEILLPFFGLSQNLGPIVDWGLNVHSHHIMVNQPYFETNVSGIYAVGDIASYSGKLKLILTGFAEAASCLHHAYARVFDGKALHFEHSTTRGINIK